MRTKAILTLALLLGSAAAAQAYVVVPSNILAEWNVVGNGRTAKAIDVLYAAEGLDVSLVTGHGVNILQWDDPEAEGVFLASSWNKKDQPSPGKYFEFSISPQAEVTLDLKRIEMDLSRGNYKSSHGADQWNLVASTDGFKSQVYDLGVADISKSKFDMPTLASFDAGGLTGITDTISFRLYGYNDGGNKDNAGFNGQAGRNLVIYGSTGGSVPEPMTLATLGLGGLLLVIRRKKA